MAVMRPNRYFYHVTKRVLYTNSTIGIYVPEFGMELHMLRSIVAARRNTTNAAQVLDFGKRFAGMKVSKMHIRIGLGRSYSNAEKLKFRLSRVMEALEKVTVRGLIISFDSKPRDRYEVWIQHLCVHECLGLLQRLHRVKSGRIEEWWSQWRLEDGQIEDQLEMRRLVTTSLSYDYTARKVIPKLGLWKDIENYWNGKW